MAEDPKYQRIHRALAPFFAMLCLVSLPFLWMSRLAGIATAFAAIGWLVVYGLLRLDRVRAARWLTSALPVLHLPMVALALGRPVEAHLYLLVSVGTPFVLYPRSERRMIAATVVAFAASYLACEVWVSTHAPWLSLEPGSAAAAHSVIVVGAVLFALVIAGYTAVTGWNADAALAAEHTRTESLLRNVLPARIAERLKRDPTAIADRCAGCTVLFADIVGFTRMSERMPAAELVGVLDEIFARFDDLADAHGLEKIKTIGDAYMAAAGVPEARPDHALAAARMALAMQDVIAGLADRHPGLRIRIGLHSGPLVAGVIGRRKFAYDVWGDTVNVASRMESHGVAGRVQVSAATAEQLGAALRVEPRGTIEIKGTEPMAVFLIVPPS
ncbi:adenylate/guanylate cyclase domain-containing protein [Nannocystis sp.]|uniref:adenylate/guanylate cyclase domain-containing protein n=1 Tax=Nannocystis sp. TaxID=1962667 RepID=UPI0025E843E2|nr:adenylate/guanylate cyclase domain-containing protein [Nannocystis sp.]MBK7827398.1 adenylate/guanylate cyclase domain-containing protein [Nannocystis sp.]